MKPVERLKVHGSVSCVRRAGFCGQDLVFITLEDNLNKIRIKAASQLTHIGCTFNKNVAVAQVLTHFSGTHQNQGRKNNAKE
jgi:hypothetical protein